MRRPLRIAFWVAAILLGSAQTWDSRHRTFSDGVSYLSIAEAYARGDWHSALNAYWSPFYSWMVALYLILFHPSAYWEVSSMHVVNFAAFLGACLVYERLFLEWESPDEILAAAYLLVLYAALVLTGIGYTSPDMIAFLLIALAAWLTWRIARGSASGVLSGMWLGIVMGIGYLDRASFAPLAAIYFASLAVLIRRRKRALWIAVAAFFVISAPFAIALSLREGRVTMGESGRLNYGWEVNGAARSTHWQGEPFKIGTPAHPTRLILREPVPVYEFATPVAGPYPPWYDPSYWYAGIQPHFRWKDQWPVFRANAVAALYYFATSLALPVLLCLFLLGGRPRGSRVLWALAIPPLAGIATYTLVYMDSRYIAGFLTVLWVTLLASMKGYGKFAVRAVQALCVLFLGFLLLRLGRPLKDAAWDLTHIRERERNISWMLASAFDKIGVKRGDSVAELGWSIDADWVRQTGARIVCEVPLTYDRGQALARFLIVNDHNMQKFFQLNEGERQSVYDAFRKCGAKIAVANNIPPHADLSGWTRLIGPDTPGYPVSDAQIRNQASTYYRWLTKTESE